MREAVGLSLLRLMSRLAPRHARHEWHSRWSSRLQNLWILVERGELTLNARAETVLAYCAPPFWHAFWLRFTRAGLRYWVRGPGFVMSGGVAALAAAGSAFPRLRRNPRDRECRHRMADRSASDPLRSARRYRRRPRRADRDGA